MGKTTIKEFINEYYDRAISLKQEFKITEKKEWDEITVLAEINVQLGHFSYLISNHKEFGELKRNIKSIGDELSDIILQLFSLCWKLKLNIKEYEYEYKCINFENIPQALLSFEVIYGQISEKILEINGYRHYKIRYNFAKESDFLYFNIARLFEIVFSISDYLTLDIDEEFNEMIKDATNFINDYKSKLKIQFYPIVDIHATWLVLNPIQGCPKQCKYCFLRERRLNKIKPITLVSPEKAVDLLTESKFYLPNIPLCLFSQTDAFSTQENIEYLKQLIKLLMEKNIKNPIVFISKCHIPDEFIKLIDKYEKLGHKFLFFLSYSGLDKSIELGVDRKTIENNFIRLAKYNKKIIHYWRPFIPQNSSKKEIDKIYNFVRKYCIASVAIGLKTNVDIIDNIDWDDLKMNKKQALQSDNVWSNEAYQYIWNKLAKKYDYPIYQTTSCALGLALNEAERKFFYGTEICLNCNRCPKVQRERCNKKAKEFRQIKKEEVILLLKKLNKEIDNAQIEIVKRNIIIKNLELSFNEISFLTDVLGSKVIATKKQGGYYWNTSINNATIMKI